MQAGIGRRLGFGTMTVPSRALGDHLAENICILGLLAATRTADMPMAGRTHGQHAVPATFGYKVAVWIDELLFRNIVNMLHGVRDGLVRDANNYEQQEQASQQILSS